MVFILFFILISCFLILDFVLFFIFVVSIPFVLARFYLCFLQLIVNNLILFLVAHPFCFLYIHVLLLHVTNLFTVPVFSIITHTHTHTHTSQSPLT